MSDKRKGNTLGDQILNAVDDILESGNFDKLNSVVSDTVSKALDEASKQLSQVAAGAGTGNAQKKAAAPKATPKPVQTYKVMTAPKAKLKKVGSVSGVLLRVFGGIGSGIFGFLFIIGFISNIVAGDSWDVLAVVGVLLAISVSLIYLGVAKSARLKRAERYVQVMQGKAYMNLSELAPLTNKSEAYVRKDVKKMIQLGIFTEGHLDKQEACLILGDVAYREYMRLEKTRKELLAEAEEQKRIEQAAQAEAEKAAKGAETVENAELRSMIQEGNECITQLQNLNDAIAGEVISAKLFRLENLLKEIFEQLKEHPEQMSEMHKFMDYYLPTTLKLVTAYEEFDRVSVPGEDILSAKAEIEKTLDTINMAFAELLNKLFRDRAFDASTDAQVLKTMLVQEGLTKEPIYAHRGTEPKTMQMQKEYK